MDDYTDEEGQQPETPLGQFVGLFNSTAGQAFAREAATRLNDYTTKRQIAEANVAAGQAFNDNLDEMRGNFTAMVHEDPTSTPLALDLAHLGVSAMVSTIHGADPEHIEPISTGMQRDIARSAVLSAADRHDELARGILDHPRVAGLLEDEKPHLADYIDNQAAARQLDAQGAQQMAQREAVDRANQSAWNYMAAVVDPDTGDISHPRGWAQSMMADPSMPPHYKAALFDTYGRLQEQGDAPVSDPTTVYDMVRDAARGSLHTPEPLSRAGADLKASDAVYISKLASDPEQRGRAAQITDALDMGREQLAALENGPGGQRAYQDFSSWVLAAARNGADLDPSSREYALAGNRLQQFAPRASYNVEAAVQVPTQGRRPLAEIFGGRGVRSAKP